VTLRRFLPILNLFGCLLISGIIVFQWLKERGLETRITVLQGQLAGSRELYQAEKLRVAALENDVVQLKESIESSARAGKQAEAALATAIAERDAQSTGLATANQEQVDVWQKAIAERDEKIRSLGTSLAATRERLDEAVTQLKAAGAR